MYRFVMGLMVFLFHLTSTGVWGQDIQIEAEMQVEDPVMTILRQRVDVYGQSVGIAVGIINGWKRSSYTYGTLSRSTRRKVSNATVYEIGAVTGVMTGVLLAHMVEKGEVGLNGPVAKFLPSSVHMPTWGGKAITLEHLATHTSGLPDLPDNLRSADPDNPLAGYHVEEMYDFLSSYTLTRAPGSSYEYSRVGLALLAHVLSLKAKRSYEDMLVRRFFTPLKMMNTRVYPTSGMTAQTPTGHDAVRKPVEPSDIPRFPGADGLRSTMNDLMIFVSAGMGIVYGLPTFNNAADSTALVSAFDRANLERHGTGKPDESIALGWRIRKDGDREIRWQQGKTRGYYGFVGFDRQKRRGVVVLSNMAESAEDIGFHLLDPEFPLKPPPATVYRVNDPQLYDAYIGTYEFAPGVTVTILKEGMKLYGQPAGQSMNELVPESEREFYLKQEDAWITFVSDESGEVLYLLFLKNGELHRGDKIR